MGLLLTGMMTLPCQVSGVWSILGEFHRWCVAAAYYLSPSEGDSSQ